jgi:asparagine synthase (glutamine-hydrolysing)
MCGIVGAIGTRDRALVESMTISLVHRGPDGKGHYSRGESHVGATRLSILDLFSGAQPIFNETEQACIVFNGEIYNHRELRTDLQRKGHVFRTATDTEVIIHLYEELGDDCVSSLHGMFAFAILDGKKLFLARDRLGIKPLYYTFVRDSQTFVFASEIKAILRYPSFTPCLNQQAFADSIVLRYLMEGDTFFEGVCSLPPGHTMTVFSGDNIRIEAPKSYYTRNLIRNENMSFHEAQERLEAALESAVETHLAADVEVGLTLSGGIDSTILALLISESLHRPIFTFTVADHERHPDVIQAELIAKMISSNHRTILLTFEDYLATIPSAIVAEERPASLFGVPFHFLCSKIAQHLKACLHGEGADELFGGYVEYLDRLPLISSISLRLPLLKHLGIVPSDRAIAKIRRLSPVSFEEYLERILQENLAEALEQHHLLPVDKSAMAASLEVRVPYLDDAVLELGSQLPVRYLIRPDLGVGKYILRRFALERFGPRILDVVLRQKLGFPSSGKILLDRFERLCDEMLPDEYVTNHEFGRCFLTKRDLLMFDMFIEIFMRHRGDSAAVGTVMDFLRERSTGTWAGKNANG